ncbi:MAG TPA: hypothetical protein VII59_21145 [Streptosporangiaceae bacterium]
MRGVSRLPAQAAGVVVPHDGGDAQEPAALARADGDGGQPAPAWQD